MICLCSIASSSWWHWLVYDLSVLHVLVLLVTLVGLWFVCAPLPCPLGDIGWSIICLCSIASSTWWHWLVYDLSVLHCLVLLVTLVGLWFVCASLPCPLGDIGWSIICLCSIASSTWWHWSVYDLSVLLCLVLLVTLAGLWFVCAPLPRPLGDIGWSMICLCSMSSSSWWHWLVYDLSVLHCLVLLVTLVGLLFVCAPLPRQLGDIGWSMICLCSIALSSWWHWLVYDFSVLHCLVLLVTSVGLWFVCVPLPRPLGDIGWSMICLCSIASSSWWHWLVYDLAVLHCLVLLVTLAGLWFVCAPFPRPFGDIGWSMICLCLFASSSCWHWLVYDLSLLHCLVLLVSLVGLWFVCAPLPRQLGDIGWSMICLCCIASSSWWHWLVYDLSVLDCLVLLVTLVGLLFVFAPLPCHLGDIGWSMICLCSIASSTWWHWMVYDLSVLHCLVLLVTFVGLWFVCARLPSPPGDIGWSIICLCSIALSSWWYWLVYDLSVLHCLVLLVRFVGLWFVCASLPRPLGDIGWSMICLCSFASSSWWHWLVYDLSVLHCLVNLVTLVGLWVVCAPLPRQLGDIGWSMICLCSIASSSWRHWLVYDLSVLDCLVLLVTLVGLWFVCAPLPCPLGDIGWSMICLCSIALSSWWHWLVYDLSVLDCLVLLVTLVGLWFVCAPLPCPLGDIGWSMICLCSIALSSWWYWLVYDLSVLLCLVLLVTLAGLWFVCAPLPRQLGDIGWSMSCLCSIASSTWWHWLVYDLSVLLCLVLLVTLVCLWFVSAPLPCPLGDIGWSMIFLCSIVSSSWWHWLVYDLSVLHCLVLLVTLVGLWFVCAPLPCPLGDIGWSMICLCSFASSSWWHWLVYYLSVLHCLVNLVTLVGLWVVSAPLPRQLGDIG